MEQILLKLVSALVVFALLVYKQEWATLNYLRSLSVQMQLMVLAVILLLMAVAVLPETWPKHLQVEQTSLCWEECLLDTTLAHCDQNWNIDWPRR